MKPPQPTERQVQRSIISMMKRLFPRVLYHHSPNGGHLAGDKVARFKQMGALKGDGMLPGFPDIVCYWNHGHCLMEVKRPGFRPSDVKPEQNFVHGELADRGFDVAIVTCPEEAYAFLKMRGAPSAGDFA